MWLVLVELDLGDADGFLEVLVGQLRIDECVAVLDEVRRFDGAGSRMPTVEEEDSGIIIFFVVVGITALSARLRPDPSPDDKSKRNGR
jgi:hypothetical protein